MITSHHRGDSKESVRREPLGQREKTEAFFSQLFSKREMKETKRL
jgi:hypothetical protein